jgi:hypothetical protein
VGATGPSEQGSGGGGSTPASSSERETEEAPPLNASASAQTAGGVDCCTTTDKNFSKLIRVKQYWIELTAHRLPLGNSRNPYQQFVIRRRLNAVAKHIDDCGAALPV